MYSHHRRHRVPAADFVVEHQRLQQEFREVFLHRRHLHHCRRYCHRIFGESVWDLIQWQRNLKKKFLVCLRQQQQPFYSKVRIWIRYSFELKRLVSIGKFDHHILLNRGENINESSNKTVEVKTSWFVFYHFLKSKCRPLVVCKKYNSVRIFLMRARQKKSDRMGMQFVKLKMFSLTASASIANASTHTTALTNYFFSLLKFFYVKL